MENTFKRSMPTCQRFITPEDTHDLCVIQLRVEHAQSALEGTGCAHCNAFKGDRSQATAACGLDLAAMVATERSLWDNWLELKIKYTAFWKP